MATVIAAGALSAAVACFGTPLLVGYVLALKVSEKRAQRLGKENRS